MSSPRVVVVGGGIAGTAAAWLLARRGARATVIHDRAGSSALYSGALDEPNGKGSLELDADARAFVDALGLWRLGKAKIATREGVVRTAFGADRALLDLEPLAGRRIAVADVPRDDWDAPLLVSAFGASPWAERTSTTFSLVPIAAVRRGHERRITSHDFAALHDEPERLAEFGKLLEESGRGHDAWLVGPWLGTTANTAVRLRAALSLPVGETTSAVGGAPGARFENAREALFGAGSIEGVRGRVTEVRERGERWVVGFERAGGGEAGASRGPEDDEIEATAVVIATGGVAAGGIEFVWDPERGHHGFRLAFRAPLTLSLDGEPGDSGGSLYGKSLETEGLGVLERVGVHADASGSALDGKLAVPGLWVAGDALSARPRTVLEAVRSGIRAGRGALQKGQA
jgi:glycerol-3-phosphate dehydrogenase subunit B